MTCATAVPAIADSGVGFQVDNGQCSFPSDQIKDTPWSLQRVLVEQMWSDTRGKGVKVAVIDTGVDGVNPQLKGALAQGKDVLAGKGNGTRDEVGHGTKVAGIIAARIAPGTGFVGIAPEATVIPIRQNDAQGGGTLPLMIKAVEHAIEAGADVINISQDTSQSLTPGSPLEVVINEALAADIVVVAAAGNDGMSGEEKNTYPASFPGVLAVAASDRNNERAPFSQPGDFIGIAAPGVDMVSTVPGGGHCVDQGTSFAAPYVSGVAALVRAKHPEWKQHEVVAHLQQTAERSTPGHNDTTGWGVVDPVAAMTHDDYVTPPTEPTEQSGTDLTAVNAIVPAPLNFGESPADRRARYSIYVFSGGLLTVALVVGSGIAIRDWRRKTANNTNGERAHG